MRHYLNKKIKDFPYKVISKFKNLEPEHAISLFCDPRGGSTWLAEILTSIPNAVIVDEPLHFKRIPKLITLGFSWRQYIPDTVVWNECKTIFEGILNGKISNSVLYRHHTIWEFIRSRQFIVKINRGKALLPWYVKQFNFKYKPLALIRHPFATVASQLNFGAWNYKFKKFEIPEGPYHNEFYKPHADYLYSLQSNEEQLAAIWCMTNQVVLNHPENNSSWITVNYENMVMEPQKYFQMIFERWDLNIPERLMSRILIPSASTRGKKNIEPEKLISDWKEKLSGKQIDRLQKVLDYFEVDFYNQHFMPIIPASQVHLKNIRL